MITINIHFCTFLKNTNRAVNIYIWRYFIPDDGPSISGGHFTKISATWWLSSFIIMNIIIMYKHRKYIRQFRAVQSIYKKGNTVVIQVANLSCIKFWKQWCCMSSGRGTMNYSDYLFLQYDQFTQVTLIRWAPHLYTICQVWIYWRVV